MKVLAVDPGFGRVGMAVLEKVGGVETLLHSKCFETDPKKEVSFRIQDIGKEIEKLAMQFSPETIAVETLFFTTNQKTVMSVAEARGVIIYAALSHGLSLAEYTPLQIKTALTGYGRADKSQVAYMVQKILGVQKKVLDDEMDAIAIGMTHFAHTKQLR